MAAIGAGLAATGIAIGAALFKAASSTAELGDAMQKAGIRTGLTTEQLSSWS